MSEAPLTIQDFQVEPLADNERIPVNGHDQGTRRWPFSDQPYHWIERRDGSGQWRLHVVQGICREAQEEVLRTFGGWPVEEPERESVADRVRREAAERVATARAERDG